MHLKSLLISLHIGVMGFPVITDNCEKQTEHIIFPKNFFNYIFRAHGYITVRFLRKTVSLFATISSSQMYRRVALRYVASYRAVASNQKPNLYKKVNLDFERKGKKKLN